MCASVMLGAEGRRVYKLELDGGMGVLMERLIQFLLSFSLAVVTCSHS